jgi:hypothetical protein
MAEYFVDPQDGSDANNGLSASAPWKKIPGQTGANAVLAGDTINVRTGTRSTGRLVLPADNLTYRGYGLASNKLMLTLPAGGRYKRVVEVVRSRGVHEGMWTLDAAGDTTAGYLAYFSRSGCSVEDCEVLAPLAEIGVTIGTSTVTSIGATLRRSKVTGSKSTGVAVATRQTLIEDCEIGYVDDDALTFTAAAANGNRAGYTDVVRRVSIIEPGMDEVAFLGDAIQTFANGTDYAGGLMITDLYVYKPSPVKQAVVLTDGTGGITLERFLIESGPNGQAQILLAGVKGRITIRRGWIAEGCKNNPAIRLGNNGGVAMATGSRLEVHGVVVDAAEHNGLFTAGAVGAACTADGRIEIHNCVLNGRNVQALSYSGALSAHAGAAITWGANAVVSFRNNLLLQTGTQPGIRLPVGGAGDARWQVFNNAIIDTATAAAIGSTEYATAAAFQSAHATSGGNLQQPDYALDDTHRPLPDSPLIGAGVFTGWALDNSGKRFRNPPTIGAFEYVRPRAERRGL